MRLYASKSSIYRADHPDKYMPDCEYSTEKGFCAMSTEKVWRYEK
jgi:hypothetical protein